MKELNSWLVFLSFKSKSVHIMTLMKKREQPLSLVILLFQDKIPHAWHEMKVKFEEEILDASRFLRSSPELV